MTEKDIKPIPEYMIAKIRKLDKQYEPVSNGKTRFYKYYTKYKKELCEVVVAVRHKYKQWYCKQVIVHGIDTDKCFLQDIALYRGFYKVGWYREGLTKYPKQHDYDWGWNEEKYFHMRRPIVNKEYISTLKEFKYSAVDLYAYQDILKYLRCYKKYPIAEMVVKLNLSNFATSKIILNKLTKDKKFRKWFYQNHQLIPQYAYVVAVLQAYTQNEDIHKMQHYHELKKTFSNSNNLERLKQLVAKSEIKTLFNYLWKHNVGLHSYEDYIVACNELELDLTLEKNRYPKDFVKWHDIRIDQWRTQKALIDAQKREKLYKRFKDIATKYLSLEHNKSEDYICIIAKSPADLMQESDILGHCVGKMNYDQKFINEESLIFFIRPKENPNTPFVTLEYSLKTKKILQCYGKYNSNPNKKILEFVNKTWLPYANKKMKKIAI